MVARDAGAACRGSAAEHRTVWVRLASGFNSRSPLLPGPLVIRSLLLSPADGSAQRRASHELPEVPTPRAALRVSGPRRLSRTASVVAQGLLMTARVASIHAAPCTATPLQRIRGGRRGLNVPFLDASAESSSTLAAVSVVDAWIPGPSMVRRRRRCVPYVV